MMATLTAKYLGNLRMEVHHEQSNTTIFTDAPVENHGKGESFSPTDLVAVSLATCATTIMGIYAQTHNVDITGTILEITKKMSQSPRRIGEIGIIFTMPNKAYADKDKKNLEKAAHTCPVHFSLHPDIIQNFIFKWAE